MNELIRQIEKAFPDVNTDNLIKRVHLCEQHQNIYDEFRDLKKSMKATEAIHLLAEKHHKSCHTIGSIIYRRGKGG